VSGPDRPVLWLAKGRGENDRRFGVKKSNENSVAARFSELSFHDDNLESVTVYPPPSWDNRTRIDFRLRDDSTGKEKLLSFLGCANIRYVMDFDVMAHNSFAQTNSSNATVDAGRMKRFVLSQTTHWHTKYMPPFAEDEPVKKKLSAIGDYSLFKITFFGGTAEILAKSYKLRRER
jgi:hypothetical protein